MPKKSPNKNLALYNKLQREFKVLNDKLPEYQRLSVKTRREIISKTIFPFLKDKKKVADNIPRASRSSGFQLPTKKGELTADDKEAAYEKFKKDRLGE